MSTKNLPNIPLYIGDWEKDCNVLTLEAEAAWLRIVFKMFTNGKQSTYKIPTKGLQNLWRVSEQKSREIVQEFIDYNICEVVVDGRFIEFTSRRFKKENEISEVRKEAVSNRKDRKKTTKPLQSTYKKDTNKVQNTDIDSDYEDEIEDENKNEVEIISREVEILNHLNETAGRQFRENQNNIKHIKARLNENWNVEQLKKVIEIKTLEWGGDPKMEKYLNPETLFRPSNIDKYWQQVLDAEKNPITYKEHYNGNKTGNTSPTVDDFVAAIYGRK